MKRFRKALIALAAFLGVVIVGGIWLVNSALNVVSDAVDSTLDGAHKVQTVAQKEVTGVARSAQNGAKAALAGAEHSVDALENPAAIAKTTSATNKVTDKETGSPSKSAEKKDVKDAEEDGLAGVGVLLNMFLNDGEDTPDPTDLLTSGDKDTTGNKPASKNADNALTNMIPGASSPTVKRWMDGKYKGKESQAIDDAIEDPQIWRLVFFLSGGM